MRKSTIIVAVGALALIALSSSDEERRKAAAEKAKRDAEEAARVQQANLARNYGDGQY